MSRNKGVGLAPIIDGFVGRVSGLNLSLSVNEETASFLARTHADYPVLAIEGQLLDADGVKAFARIFGDFEIDHHVTQFAVDGHPELVFMTNRTDNGKPDPAAIERGAAWHTDSTFKAEPCAHTIMYAMEIPSQGGGTVFADMTLSNQHNIHISRTICTNTSTVAQ